MTRRLWFGTFALVLALVACGGGGKPVSAPVKTSFVLQTVDFVDDVGYSPSLALDKDGNPHLSYLGFTHVLTKEETKRGVIPAARPVTAPRLPAVLVADQVKGLWNRGSAVQSSDLATGPKVKIERSDQTATAVDSQGVQHVVWSQSDGLFYSSDSGGSFPDQPTKITGASASGPSIAVDAGDTPWVAFYEGNAVRAGSLHGKSWSIEKVASVGGCNRCPPSRTAIAVGPAGPVIAYTDAGARSPMLATMAGKSWSTQPIERGVGGFSISMTLDPDGNPHVAYFHAGGKVDVATRSGGGWQTASPGSISVSSFASDLGGGTAVAVDGKGHEYVAWADPAAGIRLFRSTGGADFKSVTTEGTKKGESPTMAATSSGKIEMAWLQTSDADLLLGTFPQSTIGPYAVPSPQPTFGQPTGGGGGGCPKSATLSITAPAGAAQTGFDKTQLSAPANESLDVCFQNSDLITHNWEVWSKDPLKDSSAKNIATEDPFVGPASEVVKVPALPAGQYFYRCVIHPTIMTGTLAVK